MVGMTSIHTIRDLVALWPSRRDFVSDLARALPAPGVTIHQVNKWVEKSAIPAKYHRAVLSAGRDRHLPVSAELLVELHAPQEDAA